MSFNLWTDWAHAIDRGRWAMILWAGPAVALRRDDIATEIMVKYGLIVGRWSFCYDCDFSCCREYVQAFSEWAVGVLMFVGVWRMAIFRSTVNIWESEWCLRVHGSRTSCICLIKERIVVWLSASLHRCICCSLRRGLSSESLGVVTIVPCCAMVSWHHN